jgi:uncharacterized protein YcnI
MARIAPMAAALAALLAVSPSSAHITLQPAEAAAGGSFIATFRVPHGCDGAPTVRLAVRVPDEILTAKPRPKPGWTLATAKEGGVVREVTWSGGKLADEQFDEFAVLVFLPDKPGATLRFAVEQGCDGGAVEHWQPTLRLGPAAAREHEHH